METLNAAAQPGHRYSFPPAEACALYRVVYGREPPADFVERVYGRIEPPLFDRASEREVMAYACLGALVTRLMLSERRYSERRHARRARTVGA